VFQNFTIYVQYWLVHCWKLPAAFVSVYAFLGLIGKLSCVYPCLSCSCFWQDNNFGLVKQVLASMYKQNIQRLTQTYLTLSLGDIATSAQIDTPREAEMHVLRMVGVCFIAY
jgi:hypothetical protein